MNVLLAKNYRLKQANSAPDYENEPVPTSFSHPHDSKKNLLQKDDNLEAVIWVL